jgi:hypothetical protein
METVMMLAEDLRIFDRLHVENFGWTITIRGMRPRPRAGGWLVSSFEDVGVNLRANQIVCADRLTQQERHERMADLADRAATVRAEAR